MDKKLKIDPEKVEYDGNSVRLIIKDEGSFLRRLEETQTEIIKDLEKEQNMNETVTITKEEYNRLLESDIFLACLENAGVDNWDGYNYAIEEYQLTRKENEND